ISYLQNKRSLTEKITGELQSVSAQTAREMDLWVKERLYELRVFASSYEVSENLDRITRGGGAGALARLTDYLRSVHERFADYPELLVVNPRGEAVATTARQATPAHLPANWAAAIRADNAVLGDAYRDDALGKDVVIFAVPIYQTGGRFLGALTAKLDLAAVHHLLRRFAAGATGRVYLITAAGQPLVGSEAEHEALMQRQLDSAVAGGDLAVDLPVVGGGELGYVTEVFNDMVARLRDSRRELERLSITDDLTTLFNRRYVMEALANEVRRSRRLEHPFTLLMLDVD